MRKPVLSVLRHVTFTLYCATTVKLYTLHFSSLTTSLQRYWFKDQIRFLKQCVPYTICLTINNVALLQVSDINSCSIVQTLFSHPLIHQHHCHQKYMRPLTETSCTSVRKRTELPECVIPFHCHTQTAYIRRQMPVNEYNWLPKNELPSHGVTAGG